MGKLIDLTGKKFGRWRVIRKEGKDRWGKPAWICLCECGKFKLVDGGSLRTGHSKSCGCLHSERLARRSKTHGMADSPVYAVWREMRHRCQNKNAADYPRYGGRGIRVCARWEKFENFFSDMGERPPGKSIDRIDNNKGYSPDNCRWASLEEQAANKSNNRFITINGKKKTFAQWDREWGFPEGTIGSRVRRGWTLGRAFNTPVKKK